MRILLVTILFQILVSGQNPFLSAVRLGHEVTVKEILLSGNNFDLYRSIDRSMTIAVDNQRWEILKSIYCYKKLHVELFNACSKGDMEALDTLLQNPTLSPGENRNWCLQMAIRYGRTKVVEKLLQDSRIEMRDNFSIFKWIIDYNRPEIMELLLPLLLPQDNYNTAIVYACEVGRYDIVSILLKDPRVNPSARGNAAFIGAVMKGYANIVELLLNDPRIDPSGQRNNPARLACERNHTSVLNILLQDPRIEISYDNNLVLNRAVRLGHTAVVERLLEETSVLSSDLGRALSISNALRHKTIASMLRAAIKEKNEMRWNEIRNKIGQFLTGWTNNV